MGRYSQRVRRGGGPSTAAPVPPPTPPVVVAVHNNGTDYGIEFDQPITVISGSFPDSSFTIDGEDLLAASQGTPTLVTVVVMSSPASGLPWILSGQPSWLLESADIPESGATL